MRIYVASLPDYNHGHLHGVWIDLDGNTERSDIEREISTLLRTSKYPNTLVDCHAIEAVGYLHEQSPCHYCGGSGKAENAEEWAVHDYEDLPGTFGEHRDLDDLLDYVQGVEDHGDAFRAWVEHAGVTNFIHEDFEDKFAGEADTELAWIDNFLDENGTLDGIPENLRNYFDSEAYLRDMKLSGDVSLEHFEGVVYAFWN